MLVIRSIADLRSAIAHLKKQGKRIGFVPTMGALHAGHLSLVQEAAKVSDAVVVSIFVNPAQFAPHEDFSSYPRNEAADLALLRHENAAIVYLPNVAEMYPQGVSTRIHIGKIGQILEGKVRPHFFDGVALVVCKLFQQVQPDVAVFGEKDFQQIAVIRRLVYDLDMPVEIIAAPIIRDANGLALSSRNAYLSEIERTHIAPYLHKALEEAALRIREGALASEILLKSKQALLAAGFSAVDYFTLRDAQTLTPIKKQVEAVLLAVARIGNVRLLDNQRVVLKK